jgi:hypothetical protein
MLAAIVPPIPILQTLAGSTTQHKPLPTIEQESYGLIGQGATKDGESGQAIVRRAIKVKREEMVGRVYGIGIPPRVNIGVLLRTLLDKTIGRHT